MTALAFNNYYSTVKLGGIHHTVTISDSEWPPILHGIFLAQLLFYWSVSITKLSILVFYRRVCLKIQIQSAIRKFGYLVNILIFIMVGFITAFTITLLTECR
jgi:hypothetical protein